MVFIVGLLFPASGFYTGICTLLPISGFIFSIIKGRKNAKISNMAVGPDKERALAERLGRLGIRRQDVVEKFIRSGGPGGQKVNTASTCVYLKHLPTGIEVKMSRERSQALNRFLAWRLLADKIEERVLHIKSERRQMVEKLRRQKRKRSRRAKEKILREKKLHSMKKKLRRDIG
ncbi:MAG: peptide chain release factor-like protein [Candidatus Margulisiibacteriota bacterium]